MVRLLLKILTIQYEPNDNFIQYIIVSILNSLACQVDYGEKRSMGDLGAVEVIPHRYTGLSYDRSLSALKNRLQES